MNRNIFQRQKTYLEKKPIHFQTNIQMAEWLVWEKFGFSQDCAIGGL